MNCRQCHLDFPCVKIKFVATGTGEIFCTFLKNIHHKLLSRMGVDQVSWGKSCRVYLALFRH